tara:strand:+ start:1489 stop:2364 length:876 start_codon:yes stop_codon:yes gene_type:complete
MSEETEVAEDAPVEEAPAQETESAGAASDADTSWRDGIEDESVKKLAERYTSPAALAKALSETQKDMHSRIKVPGDDASDEDLAKYRKALGVPETADQYEIVAPEHLSEDVFKSEQVQTSVRGFTEAMHSAGASKAAVDAALNWYWGHEASTMETRTKGDQEAMLSAEATLRKEWSGDYDKNTAIAKEFINQHGPDVLTIELKDGSLLGSHPEFVRMSAEAGRKISEGALQMGLRGTDAAVDMEKQHEELSRDIYDAHLKGDIDKAKRLDAERSRLSSQIYGERPITGRAV